MGWVLLPWKDRGEILPAKPLSLQVQLQCVQAMTWISHRQLGCRVPTHPEVQSFPKGALVSNEHCSIGALVLGVTPHLPLGIWNFPAYSSEPDWALIGLAENYIRVVLSPENNRDGDKSGQPPWVSTTIRLAPQRTSYPPIHVSIGGLTWGPQKGFLQPSRL